MGKSRKINIPTPGTLDWELLRRFNIITQSQSFSEAAERIGTSQPALLKQMDDLERFLHKKLFETPIKKRSLDLTPDGKLLRTVTNQALELFNKQVVDKIETTKPHKERELLRVFTTPGLATTLLPDLMTEFLKQHDHLAVDLITQVPAQRLNVGELQIRHDYLRQPDIRVVDYCTITFNFYATQEYCLIHGEPKSLQDLKNHQILSIKYYRDHYHLLPDRLPSWTPLIQSDYIGFLVEMALRGWGVVELPTIHPATQRLYKLQNIETERVDISLIYLDIKAQTPGIQSLVNFLRQKQELFLT